MDKLPNIHPGEILREEFLRPLEMTAYRLAQNLGVHQTAISEILNGKRRVSAAMALRFSRFFGTTARFWLNLQDAYDLEEEASKMGDKLTNIQPLESAPALSLP